MGLLHWGLAVEKQLRLGVVVGKFLGLGPHLGLLFFGPKFLGYGHKALRTTGLKRAAATQGVGLVGDAPAWDGLAVHAVALVVVDRCERRVDGEFVEVGAAQARDLGVDVGVDATGQQRVVGEVDAGHHMGDTESHLLRFRKKIVGVAVEHHAAHFFVRVPALRE